MMPERAFVLPVRREDDAASGDLGMDLKSDYIYLWSSPCAKGVRSRMKHAPAVRNGLSPSRTRIGSYDVTAAQRFERAVSLMHAGEHRASLDIADALLSENPRDARANLLSARMLHIAGRHAEARRRLDGIAVEGHPERERLENDIRVMREFGLFQEAFPRDAAIGMARARERAPAHLRAGAVADAIAAALRERRGFSLIRIGDGEGAFVSLGAEDEARFAALYAHNRRDRAQIWFGGAVDPNADPWISQARTITDAIAEADIVGLPYPSWLEHEYRIASITGISALTNALRASRATNGHTCTQLIHVELHNAGLIQDLLRGQRTIGLISCHQELTRLLPEAFGIADIEFHHVPGEKGHDHLLPDSATRGEHWPTRFRQIMADLSSRSLHGRLFVVAAGILGKFYCNQIRRAGGVAVDLGSIADGWVGIVSRPGMSADLHLSRTARPSAPPNDPPSDLALGAFVRDILESGSKTALDGSFVAEVGDLVDQHSTRIMAPEEMLAEAYQPDRRRLLDYRCGTGGWRQAIEGMGYAWRGVNYLAGMAEGVRAEARAETGIDFYDGTALPYPDSSFDVVFSFQVFEHVHVPRAALSEIARVLKPGGRLIGSVSYLEQFHDYSTFNFTPYGLKLAAQSAGLRLSRVYPSYDVFTWMGRRLLIVTRSRDDNKLSAMLSRENVIHEEFLKYGARMGHTPAEINLIRLMFSAHFSFLITKPDRGGGSHDADGDASRSR